MRDRPDIHTPDTFARVNSYLLLLRNMDWHARDGPMRLSSKLKWADIQGAVFLVNLRRLLVALAEDGAEATATGNLSRAFVARMFERLELSEAYRKSLSSCCKVINEHDLWPLHLVRIVAECAGLLRRRGKRFTLTRAGRDLLPEEHAGKLYRTVFIAYFRKFDLTYDFHLRPVPGIQDTMAAILWRLDAMARDWTPVQGLASRILLPKVHQLLRAAMTHPAHDTEEWILGGHVVLPLVELGLIERDTRLEWKLLEAHEQIRLTRLWRQFIWFDSQM